jgi:hypothetical protein
MLHERIIYILKGFAVNILLEIAMAGFSCSRYWDNSHYFKHKHKHILYWYKIFTSLQARGFVLSNYFFSILKVWLMNFCNFTSSEEEKRLLNFLFPFFQWKNTYIKDRLFRAGNLQSEKPEFQLWYTAWHKLLIVSEFQFSISKTE